jgi:N-acyl-D-amino-acid deacylase
MTRLCSAFVLACCIFAPRAFAEEPVAAPLVTSAQTDAALKDFDARIADLMRRHAVPAGAVAVAKDDRLVYAQGFGYADAERTTPVRPEMLFRIASVSKPITAVAVLRLVDQGRLKLDEPAFARLPQFDLDAVPDLDERLCAVSVRQLLEHSGGWDRDVEFDPMFRAVEAAEEMHSPAPASADTVIRYMLKRKLNFDPGSKYAYSNFGFCLLGRIIESVTGQDYEQAVQELVLHPAGITRMTLGKSHLAERAPDEVVYDAEADGEAVTSVFPADKEPVLWCYGGFHLEAMDAHGGWIASPIDLVHFALAVDGRRGEPLLTPEALREMTARPSYGKDLTDQPFIGLSWSLRDEGSEKNWWHSGSLPGTSALLVRAHNGLTWAVVFNDRPAGDDARRAFHTELDALFWEVSGAVREWPTDDLFTKIAP